MRHGVEGCIVISLRRYEAVLEKLFKMYFPNFQALPCIVKVHFTESLLRLHLQPLIPGKWHEEF